MTREQMIDEAVRRCMSLQTTRRVVAMADRCLTKRRDIRAGIGVPDDQRQTLTEAIKETRKLANDALAAGDCSEANRQSELERQLIGKRDGTGPFAGLFTGKPHQSWLADNDDIVHEWAFQHFQGRLKAVRVEFRRIAGE